MGLETGTYISDFVLTNPPGTDVESQGANHLRLIKTLVQQTFPTANRAISFPRYASKSANYTVLKSDDQTTFLCDTTGGTFNLTLPTTLAAGDAGWQVSLIKTNTGTAAVFWVPGSGTLQSGYIAGLSSARRCIPGVVTTALWTGTSFILTRATNLPVGALVHMSNTNAQVGYEPPDGRALAAGSYPEWNSVIGISSAPDARGRSIKPYDNMGGSTAGRISVAGGNFDGTTANVWGTGGGQNHTLTQAELPNIQSTISGTASVSGSASVNKTTLIPVGSGPSDATVNTAVTSNHVPAQASGWTYPDISVTLSSSGSISGNVAWPNIGQAGGTSFLGSGTAHSILDPTIVLGAVLVVE